ncbi:hypothetical protein BGZ81_003125 [Podila clonocystis]|nr:hypothetical protein BGZ81_003125 [Podila clonocystis]
MRLDTEDYEEMLKRAWKSEVKRLNNPDKVVVDIFAYLRDADSPQLTATGSQDQIRRSSKRRIQESEGYLSSAVRDGLLPPMGSMTTAYFARHLAKRAPPSTGNPPAIPQIATFRQFQHLDIEREALSQRTAAENEERQNEYCTLDVQIRVKKSQLGQALGLPDINLDGIVNFEAGDLADPEDDLEDADHADD